MDERLAAQYGLEFLGKFFATTQDEDDAKNMYARSAYAPISQNDALFDPALERVAGAIQALGNNDLEVARSVLNQVSGIESNERRMSNFSGYLNAHHPTSLAGWAALTPDMTMSDNNKAVKLAQDAGIITGTDRHSLLSGTKSFFHPAAHTNPRTQTTGGYKASIKTNEQFRQDTPEARIKAALPFLSLEQDISKRAFRLAGEEEFRSTLGKFLGMPVEDLISTEQDTSLRKGSKRTLAASHALLLPESFARGVAQQIKQKYSPEIMIPVMEAFPRKGRPGMFNQFQIPQDSSSDAIDKYLITERPGLGEALDFLQSGRLRRRR